MTNAIFKVKGDTMPNYNIIKTLRNTVFGEGKPKMGAKLNVSHIKISVHEAKGEGFKVFILEETT